MPGKPWFREHDGRYYYSTFRGDRVMRTPKHTTSSLLRGFFGPIAIAARVVAFRFVKWFFSDPLAVQSSIRKLVGHSFGTLFSGTWWAAHLENGHHPFLGFAGPSVFFASGCVGLGSIFAQRLVIQSPLGLQAIQG